MSESLLSQSRFKDGIDSFFSPSPSEIHEIRTLLVDPRLRVADLNRQIAALETERDALAAHISFYESLLAPIRRVPDDILREIFLAVLAEQKTRQLRASVPPLLFGHVSRRWRSLSRATPLLWNRVDLKGLRSFYQMDSVSEVVAITPSADALHAIGRVVADWIACSGQAPLAISYHEGLSIDNTRDDILQSIFQAAFSAPERIERLKICAETSIVKYALTLGQLPRLKSIEINTMDPWLDLAFGSTTAILSSPCLQSLFLRGRGNPFDLPCRWEQLTELGLTLDSRQNYMDGLTCGRAVTILARAPNLVRCHLALTLQVSHEEFTASASLPHLQELSISHWHWDDEEYRDGDLSPEPLLSRISVPKLQLLRLGFPKPDPVDFNYGKDIFGSDSGDTLLVHIFAPLIVMQPCILDLLRAVPTRTTYLHFVGGDWPPPNRAFGQQHADIFYTILGEDQSLLPHLREIQIQPESTLSAVAMAEFVRRVGAVRPALRSLVLHLGVRDKKDMGERAPEMLKVEAEGLVKLVYPPPLSEPPKWKYSPEL
ncbi:hypothetical protein HMN09_00985600 [Mycena chlorophos]|uniref:F-box domain-containing protein n=1 Tax=Mycena chlorophos TaxID=658473 RepID=A0A8H6SHL3_MYCCL|nr:hypothetical protein HMN09_00985600 [Mycena chlorophos]